MRKSVKIHTVFEPFFLKNNSKSFGKVFVYTFCVLIVTFLFRYLSNN